MTWTTSGTRWLNEMPAQRLSTCVLSGSGSTCSLSIPEMGRRREDLASNLRAFVFGDFVVFYLPDDAGVVLARVLHHRRDVRPNLWGWLKEGP